MCQIVPNSREFVPKIGEFVPNKRRFMPNTLRRKLLNSDGALEFVPIVPNAKNTPTSLIYNLLQTVCANLRQPIWHD